MAPYALMLNVVTYYVNLRHERTFVTREKLLCFDKETQNG